MFGFYGVGFDSVRVLVHFFTFGFGLVIGKTWVLVRFVLTGFGFFPISMYLVNISRPHPLAGHGMSETTLFAAYRDFLLTHAASA